MSQLCIYPEDAPDQVLLETQDADQIQQALAAVGVAFRRWPLHAVTESEQVLATLVSLKYIPANLAGTPAVANDTGEGDE